MNEPVVYDPEVAGSFLSSIYLDLPGYLWIGTFDPHPQGRFFNTDKPGIAAAVEHAGRLDDKQPDGIYWRVSTLQRRLPSGRRGCATDTLAVPALWADIDFGAEGHVLKDDQVNPPTFDEAVNLISYAGLPEPSLLIHSGGGAYPLWLLEEGVTTAQASVMSERIQKWLEHAAAARGWHYGTGVGDLARVLRLPGTVNRKTDNHRPCRVVGGAE